MDTLTERLDAMLKADAKMLQECATLFAESASRMCQAQLDTADRVCSETTRQCRELISADAPSEVLRDWPKALEANLRSASEATRAYLENAIELQSGLTRILHAHLPVLNQHFFDSVGEATRVARSVGTIELGRPEDEYEEARVRQPA